VIALAVRWYARFRLSDADVAEWLAERGFAVDRCPIDRWVQRFLPLFRVAARRHRTRVGKKWRVDETSCHYQGKQAYIYRAIDAAGQVVDACFSERRNGAAAQAFFERTLAETEVTPVRITTDKATCYPPALRTVLPGVEHRRSKYLNNGLERDHSHLKQRLYPMRSFNRGRSADTLARGHALSRNLRGGCSPLTAAVAPTLRLATAWPQLMQAISRRIWPPAAIPHRRGARAGTACPLSRNGTTTTPGSGSRSSTRHSGSRGTSGRRHPTGGPRSRAPKSSDPPSSA
jgi:transposase-like protein